MRGSDIQWHPPNRVLRQFAVAWLLVLGSCGGYQWLARGHTAIGLTLVSGALIIGGAGWIVPAAIRWLFVACTLAAFPIGWAVSQVLLLIMFYGIITPVALLFRVRGRDLLCRKPTPERQSLWQSKTLPGDVRRYLRQY